jgi:asparagine synthase (glutamine-hydrolysing)
MCGIVGFTGAIDSGKLDSMLNSIQHRGPDGEGKLKKPQFSMGMRRLSIIDPASGWQPIWNEDQTVAIILNGEIYNYQELRDELVKLGHKFNTDHSDTETIVHAYEEWGVEAVNKLRGMFVFAIWDSHKEQLWIVRDRLGIKPLYYTVFDNRLIFASELKALTKGWGVTAEPDNSSVYKFLRYRLHDNSESTFFAGIKRLLPAHYMLVDLSSSEPRFSISKYWNPQINTGFQSEKSDVDYAAEFRSQFIETIRLHLISDVPLGAALSGGLDSSGIVSIAAKLRNEGTSTTHTQELLTFSAIFPGQTIDESDYIQEVVNYTGAKMLTTQPHPDEFWNEIMQWVYFQEEPTISSAPYAYYSVYRLAQQHVKVMLSGNGGDELLAGYIPYFQAYLSSARDQGKVWDQIREIFAGSDLYWQYAKQLLQNRINPNQLHIQDLLQPGFIQKYQDMPELNFANLPNLNERLWQDVSYSSVPNLTRYDDKNSMAFSIESRPPFLDHKLVEYILQLPIDQKIKYGWNRYIYRNAMKGLMPEKNRKRRSKIGFTNPELSWLKIKADKYREIFASDSFRARPYWDGTRVAKDFEEVLLGKRGDILMFWRILHVELWLRTYCD